MDNRRIHLANVQKTVIIDTSTGKKLKNRPKESRSWEETKPAAARAATVQASMKSVRVYRQTNQRDLSLTGCYLSKLMLINNKWTLE